LVDPSVNETPPEVEKEEKGSESPEPRGMTADDWKPERKKSQEREQKPEVKTAEKADSESMTNEHRSE
jgi:hypothetical protein